MKQKTKDILTALLVLIFLYVLLKTFLLPTITSDEFRRFTEELGPAGYFIIIGYTVLSHIFAPLAGTPGVLLGVSIYGTITGMSLLYISSVISAAINFQIARKYGRKWVTKLVGEKSMKEVDAFTAVEGKEVLILSRLFGFSIFEFISYAAGLTQISFRDYMIITSLVHAVPSLLFAILFKNLDVHSETGITIWLGSIVIAGIIFGILIKQYLSLRKR